MKAETLIRWVLPYIKHSPLDPGFINRNSIRKFLKNSLNRIQGLLLEVGCGEKEFTDILAPHISEYVGLEHPAARETQGQLTARPEVYGTALNLPFPDETFDTVLCICLLEHVSDPIAVLRECRRVLKPGGYILTSTPLAERVHCAPYDFYRFTPYGLQYVAKQADLNDCRITSFTGTWASIGLKLSKYILYNFIFTRTECYADRKVRIWALPLAVPICTLIQLTFLGLDRLHRDEHDAEQYFMVARRPVR